MDGRPVAEVIALEAIGEGYWVHRPGLARGGRVGVAGRISCLHREDVRAVAQAAQTGGRGARSKDGTVEPALEGRPGLVRREREGGRRVVDERARTGANRCLRRSV